MPECFCDSRVEKVWWLIRKLQDCCKKLWICFEWKKTNDKLIRLIDCLRHDRVQYQQAHYSTSMASSTLRRSAKASANQLRNNNNRNYSFDPSINCLRPEHCSALCKRNRKKSTFESLFCVLKCNNQSESNKRLFFFFISLMEKVFTFFFADFLFSPCFKAKKYPRFYLDFIAYKCAWNIA